MQYAISQYFNDTDASMSKMKPFVHKHIDPNWDGESGGVYYVDGKVVSIKRLSKHGYVLDIRCQRLEGLATTELEELFPIEPFIREEFIDGMTLALLTTDSEDMIHVGRMGVERVLLGTGWAQTPNLSPYAAGVAYAYCLITSAFSDPALLDNDQDYCNAVLEVARAVEGILNADYQSIDTDTVTEALNAQQTFLMTAFLNHF